MAVVKTEDLVNAGKLHKPRIMVVDQHQRWIEQMYLLGGQKEPIILNGCEIVPVMHDDTKTATPKPPVKVMNLEELLLYANDPQNKIDGVLTYYKKGGDSPGYLIKRHINLDAQPGQHHFVKDLTKSFRIPVVIHTMDSINEVGNSIPGHEYYDKSEMMNEDPNLSGLAALKQTILGQNRAINN